MSESQPLLSRATVPSVKRGLAPCRQRTTLLTSNLGRIETLQRRDSWELRSGEGCSPEFQVCLPYSGLFVWHVGRDDVIADANQVLFVTAGVELPHANDLTALAFDRRFSSHSHFAAARRCTPSGFRAAVGCRGRRLPEVIEAP